MLKYVFGLYTLVGLRCRRLRETSYLKISKNESIKTKYSSFFILKSESFQHVFYMLCLTQSHWWHEWIIFHFFEPCMCFLREASFCSFTVGSFKSQQMSYHCRYRWKMMTGSAIWWPTTIKVWTVVVLHFIAFLCTDHVYISALHDYAFLFFLKA